MRRNGRDGTGGDKALLDVQGVLDGGRHDHGRGGKEIVQCVYRRRRVHAGLGSVRHRLPSSDGPDTLGQSDGSAERVIGSRRC